MASPPPDGTPRAAFSPSLNGLLSGLVVGAMLPLVVLIVWLAHADYRANRDRAAQQGQSVARAMALALERELRGTIGSLEALALSPSLARGDLVAFRREAEMLARIHYPGASVALLEPDGHQLFNTFKPAGSPLPIRPNIEALGRVVTTGRPAVSDLFMATLQRVPLVPIDVPVHGDDGQVKLILSLAPPLKTFADIIRQQRPDPGWVVSIMDRKRTIIARTHEPERFIGQPAAAGLQAVIGRSSEGTEELTTLEGKRLIANWSHPGESGWSVVVGISPEAFYGPFKRGFEATLAFAAFVLLAALGLARFAAGRIARPVRSLVDFATRRPSGAAVERGTLGLREADAVAAALADTMAQHAAAEARLRSVQEQGRAELEALVGERTQALRAAQADLLQVQRLDAVGQLTAGVAHDFNNLLQAQIAGLELLIDELDGQEAALRYAEMAIAASEHGAKLTHSLLAFSRKQVLRPEAIAVAPLLERLRHLLSRTLDPRIGLVIQVAADLTSPFADPAQLEAAILNLCLNGRDAMAERGGRLLIEVSPGTAYADAPGGLDPARAVVVAVSDEGSGMDKETVARACEPFFTTKGVGRGSGLGLAMVLGFSRQSGGELRVVSEVGVGTRVEIWLPHAEAEPAAPDAARSRDQNAACRGSVLLVDDEPLVRELVGDALERSGFTVIRAPTGEAAVDVLRSNRNLHMLVTDYALPGITGGEVVRQAERLRCGLPALVITGYAEAAQLGQVPVGIEVLHKPFRAEQLVDRIARVLGAEHRVLATQM